MKETIAICKQIVPKLATFEFKLIVFGVPLLPIALETGRVRQGLH
jgi:hypothetical protein